MSTSFDITHPRKGTASDTGNAGHFAAKRLTDAGTDTDLDAGWTPEVEELDDPAWMRCEHIALDQAPRWAKAGFEPATADAWAGRFQGIEEAKTWESIGVTPATHQQWADLGFDDVRAQEWVAAGRGLPLSADEPAPTAGDEEQEYAELGEDAFWAQAADRAADEADFEMVRRG